MKKAQDKVKQMGLWAPNHPVEFGGLGLSMVYGVARQSGGTARIDSRPGEGTRVEVQNYIDNTGVQVADRFTVATGFCRCQFAFDTT